MIERKENMPDSLLHQKCVPCEGGTEPLKKEEEDLYYEQTPDWTIIREGVHQLVREFEFKNFREVLDVVNKIGEIAESEGHHPNLYIHDWKKLKVELTTHAIGGLSINDFILAVKIDEMVRSK